MPERPLLKLPEPEGLGPKQRYGGGADIAKPSRARQAQRLLPRFARLMAIAEHPQQLLDLRADPASIAPERAIVFEVAGSLKDFYAQARSLGLDYLGDFEDEFVPTADFFDRDNAQTSLAGRIYLAMPDVQALRELLSLWKRFTEGHRMHKGRGPWRELFVNLIDIRPWRHEDRVPPETLSYWRRTLAARPGQSVRFEIELWFFEDAVRRDQAFQRVTQEITAINGTIFHHAVIPEIRYDAALVDVPANQIEAILEHPDISLARADDVMFFGRNRLSSRQAPNGREQRAQASPPMEL